MKDSSFNGVISFVNYEKQYATIEYEQNGRNKSISGSITSKNLAPGSSQKHHFVAGDTVNFTLERAPKGDRMIAADIKFLYNTAMEVLINKAKTENKFAGYIKKVDDKYFVKEVGSYLFFPLQISPWQLPPDETASDGTVFFSLENFETKGKLHARLYNNQFIPEFYQAVKASKSQTPIEATVAKITPHGIYLHVFGEQIQAKLSPEKLNAELNVGDKLNVKIIHLSPTRIIVEPVL